jgi:hypothetical protein
MNVTHAVHTSGNKVPSAICVSHVRDYTYVFWGVTPCSLINRCQPFRGACCQHLQGLRATLLPSRPQSSHQHRTNLESCIINLLVHGQLRPEDGGGKFPDELAMICPTVHSITSKLRMKAINLI